MQKRPIYNQTWTLAEMTDYTSFPWMEKIMRYIEPKIIREGFLPCWIWGGSYKVVKPNTPYERAYPLVRINKIPLDHSSPLEEFYVHRFMAETFFDVEPGQVVIRLCERTDCVNPNHLQVTYRNNPNPGRNPLT